MISPNSSEVRPWLLIEASQEGVLRFGTASPSPRPRISHVREVSIAGLPTFTDALQQFERESGTPLRGLEACMAIAGATSGETISLVRSRWTISRAGLAAVFGRPITIINDVAARAWATRSGNATVDLVRGVGSPSLNRPGRYAMVMVEEGVGACAIDVDQDSNIRILESETGHTDFSPASEREEKLAKAIRGQSPFVSWERMLMLDRQDPVWGQACPEMLEAERSRLLAGMLGRFSVNLMHHFGAWQGVMLTGARAGRLLDSGNRPYFEAAFAARRNFSRLIIGTPAWRVDQREAVLAGAAERLAQNFELGLSQAA